MLTMLLAYDATGNVVATLDHMVAQDAARNVVGLVDFEAHELAGGSMTDVWVVGNAVGSGTWPERLGARAHDFAVELDPSYAPGKHRIAALVHRTSGHRRERVAIMAEIERRTAEAAGEPPDLGDLLGSPTRPLRLDEEGGAVTRSLGARPVLPLIGPSNLPTLVVS